MRRTIPHSTVAKYLLTSILLGILLAGCSSFPPSRTLPETHQSQPFRAPTMLPTSTVTSPPDVLLTPDSEQITGCTNDLLFIGDVTVPDGTQIEPGTVLTKEWKVKNSGSCNWNDTYTVHLVSGSDLGASSPQALVPARNGSEAVIQIEITAPDEPGTYSGTWRAYDSDGQPFGEWFSVEIIVTSP